MTDDSVSLFAHIFDSRHRQQSGPVKYNDCMEEPPTTDQLLIVPISLYFFFLKVYSATVT